MKKLIIIIAIFALILSGCAQKEAECIIEPEATQAVNPSDTGDLITEVTAPPAQTPAVTATPTAPPTPAPTPVPTPVPTPAPTPAPTPIPAIVITKHPSSETVSPGGGTWFITKAENETQITWEVFSPDGTMYSLQQAMSAHSGLVLEALPEDTLALRNIPSSFSGWSVRARYDGPGGTATTERATVTVRTAYETVIETYRTVHRTGKGNIEYGISELVNDYHFLGYTISDIDGNGVNELILASDGNNDFPNVIYEIYTLQNGNAVSITKSAARSRYFMLNDGRFLLEGSSGAAFSNWDTFIFNGYSLAISEQIWTTDQPHELSDAAPYYYYGGAYGEGSPATHDAAAGMIADWESKIYLPALTPIT